MRMLDLICNRHILTMSYIRELYYIDSVTRIENISDDTVSKDTIFHSWTTDFLMHIDVYSTSSK